MTRKIERGGEPSERKLVPAVRTTFTPGSSRPHVIRGGGRYVRGGLRRHISAFHFFPQWRIQLLLPVTKPFSFDESKGSTTMEHPLRVLQYDVQLQKTALLWSPVVIALVSSHRSRGTWYASPVVNHLIHDLLADVPLNIQ
jgi:hypothetical protein